ncbi:MAG: PKD domain-containing protein [Bacteroidota bacterium]
MKRFLILALTLCCSVVFSQDLNHACGTEVSPEQEEYMNSLFSTRSRTASIRLNEVPIVEIPLKIHVIRESDGSGGLTEGSVNSAVEVLNGYFQNSNMRFFLHEGINFIDDSDFYNLSSSQEGAIAVPNDVRNVINVYFSGSLSSNGTPLCGYTRFPPSSDRVFVANGCVSGGTFEHELGHYFTLYHTHGKTNTGTTDELVDGSNCLVAGDDICDTPADPNLSGVVSGSCAYTGGARDTNGDFFVPMVNNIMAYSLDQCQNAFTEGQYERMRTGFEFGRSYLDFKSTSFTALFTSSEEEVCVGSTITFEANSFGAISFEWEFPGGNPSTSSDEKPRIEYATPGTYDVTLTARNNSGEIVVVRKPSLVVVNDPLENAVSDLIDTRFQESTIPSGWSIDNPDNSFSFDISDIDLTESASSNSVYMNNYDYSTDVLGNVDWLVAPTIDPEGVRGFTLKFNYAYTYRNAEFDGVNVSPPSMIEGRLQ